MIEQFIGKTNVVMRAVIGAYDSTKEKQCLTMPSIQINDEIFSPLDKDHLWFNPSKNWIDYFSFKQGEVIEFTCTIRQYVGINDDCVQVKKFSIKKVRNVKRIK